MCMPISKAISLMLATFLILTIPVYMDTSIAVDQTLPLPLKVVDNQILNSKDEPVILHGVNIAGLEWSSDGEGHLRETARVAIDDWHVNHIRLPLSQDRWFGKTPEQDDEGQAYRALVDQIVQLCASKGVYILLDLHWSNTGQWGQNIGQHSMPDVHSLAFWKDLAPMYANYPSVLFDLYNEPHDVTWDVWLKGGTVTDRPNRPGREAKTYEAVGMQTLLDAVRATGAKNVIVAGGLDWAYDFSGILEGKQLKDPNGNGVIYANHCYDNKKQSVFTWIANMKEATAVFPVIVSEFGGSGGPDRRRGWWGSSPANAMGDDWLLHMMQALHDNHWSWTAWDMHVSAGPTLISDWDYTPTPDFGAYVKQMLQGIAPGYTAPDPTKLAQVLASPLPEWARFGAEALYGDWQIESEAGRGQRSILSFSGDKDGMLTGQWINFRGFHDLEDVRFQDNQFSFVQTVHFDEEAYQAIFIGTIEGDKLSGTLTHGAAQTKMQGRLAGKKIPPIIGKWELTYQDGGRDITATLDIQTSQDGKLTVIWSGRPGEHQISDVQYKHGRLIFTMTTTINNQKNESVFKGTVYRATDTLTGVLTSEWGDIAVQGKRIDPAVVGTWILDVQSPWGPSQQRLKINRDLTGMYGIYPLEAVNLDGNNLTFKIIISFGSRTFEMNFQGQADGNTLTGDLTAFRGTQKVAGRKVGL